eukprot:CAMPEP_0195282848 /NCGR_PEP_ID=MMETSP0707-20130614/1593_1 /TAXON_ID=33640 /ORGANISM="Asterionellopsis glacialis, Strain CCMP134" /LENGTH=80 /DNA_ID=CAMNT_0040341907 /DNA_START=21 /DNA_END=259 /DNA_ORIENTATION=+
MRISSACLLAFLLVAGSVDGEATRKSRNLKEIDSDLERKLWAAEPQPGYTGYDGPSGPGPSPSPPTPSPPTPSPPTPSPP